MVHTLLNSVTNKFLERLKQKLCNYLIFRMKILIVLFAVVGVVFCSPRKHPDRPGEYLLRLLKN